MTKKVRTILFSVFLLLFVLIAPSVVLYCQGYRIDLENKRISQTGGLFLKVQPKQVEIYLNGKLKKRTDFFFGSILIENLLPKKYKVEVKKEGYHPWEKELEIKEKEVIELKDIILFPQDPELNILAREVNDFWFSPDQRKIILKENSPINGETSWALKLYELDKEVKSHLVKKEDISSKEVNLLSLTFSEDSKEVYLEFGVAEQIRYFTLNLERAPPTLLENEPPKTTPEIFVCSKEVKGDLYYLDNSGHLFKNQDKLTQEPFPVKQETKYALEIFPDNIFLIESKDLYRLNQESKSFEKFFEGINDLKISPDSQKLAYFSDYEIWILFLSATEKAEGKLFLARLSEKISDIYWLNSNYLVFNSGNKVKIAEIDARDKINIIDLTELKNPRIFWNKVDKELYILSEGDFYYSGILLP
jgi:WD40 repeat protein